MSDQSSSQSKSLDDKLAQFADQVLGGQVSSTAGLGDEDPEMGALAQTVMRLNEEFRSDQPDVEMAERIKSRLIAEWQRINPAAQTAAPKMQWWQKLVSNGPSSYSRQQTFALALAAIMVVILAAVLLSPLSTGEALPGTVETSERTVMIALLIGAALLGVLFWVSRRKP